MFIVLSQSLPKLKIIDLSDSRNLIKTPDFTEAPNLENLILFGCFKLKKFPKIIGDMKRLRKLKLDCTDIKELPYYTGSSILQKSFDSTKCRLQFDLSPKTHSIRLLET
jgi:hypothetical protein